jgi:hypothetical protein
MSRPAIIGKLHIKAVLSEFKGSYKQVDQPDIIISSNGLFQAEEFGLVPVFSGDEFHLLRYTKNTRLDRLCINNKTCLKLIDLGFLDSLTVRLVAVAALIACHFQPALNVIESSEITYTTEASNSNRADVMRSHFL